MPGTNSAPPHSGHLIPTTSRFRYAGKRHTNAEGMADRKQATERRVALRGQGPVQALLVKVRFLIQMRYAVGRLDNAAQGQKTLAFIPVFQDVVQIGQRKFRILPQTLYRRLFMADARLSHFRPPFSKNNPSVTMPPTLCRPVAILCRLRTEAKPALFRLWV